MKAKLISREHGEFVFRESATIGRSSSCTVTVDTTVVSGEHARINFDSEREAYVLEDLGSLNGTLLDGVQVERKELLTKLHVIRFGGSEDFIFQLLATGEDSDLDTIDVPPVPPGEPDGKTQVGGEAPTLPAALRYDADGSTDADDSQAAPAGTRVEQGMVPVPEILAEASAGGEDAAPAVAPPTDTLSDTTFALEFLLQDRPQLFGLAEGDNVIGRSRSASIRLDFPDLSRRHATLTVTEGTIVARDEGSRNHTFVNDERIEGEVSVQVGAKIVFGRLEARVVAAPGGPDSIAETRRQSG